MEQAAKYAKISELSRRVAEWEEKISPKLLEEVSTQEKAQLTFTIDSLSFPL